jgi:F0F1-type ATP synthase assembly protein I
VREQPQKSSLGEAMRRLSPYLGLGWTFAITVGVGVAAGWWLDRWLRTSPWLLLAGTFLGIAAAFVSFFRTVLPPHGGGEDS